MEPIKNLISPEQKSSSPEKTTETSARDFVEIELDEAEIQEALRKGREAKHFQLRREEYGKMLFEDPKVKQFSWKEFYDMLSDSIQIDNMNTEVVELLCHYFAQDPEFELQNESFKLTKGIILFGGVGVGKTTLMRAFSRNPRASYVLRMCRQIEDEFSVEGDKVLRVYSGEYFPKDIQFNPFRHRVFGICFDDLGTEPISKYYGKDSNVMAEVILNRYDNNIPNNLTHITTNLSVKEIEERYGSRVTDRMIEMFNLISFPKEATSRRV